MESSSPAPRASTSPSGRAPIGRIAAGVLALAAAALALIAWAQAHRDPERLRAEARAALQAGDPARAEAALARLPEPTEADWMLRAEAAVAGRRADAALAALGHIPDSSPLAGQARLMAGQVELRRNRMRLAEANLLRAIELDPAQLQARRELIYIYGMQLRREAIAGQFQALAEVTPLTFDQVFLWCLIRGNKWRAREHSATLQEYVAADPTDRWSRLALSDSYLVLGRPDEAESVLAPLPDSDPEAVERRARLALARGELERVEALLSGAPAGHAGLERLRGSMALRNRDARAAIGHYEAADAIEPGNRDTLLGLSRAYTLAGEAEQAAPFREYARRLEELSTLIQYASTGGGRDDPELPMKLGQACERIGRVPEARAWYQLAVTRDPLDRAAQQALYRLRRTGPAEPTGARD